MQNHDESARNNLGPIPRPYTSGEDEVNPVELQRVPPDAVPLTRYEIDVREQERIWERQRYED